MTTINKFPNHINRRLHAKGETLAAATTTSMANVSCWSWMAIVTQAIAAIDVGQKWPGQKKKTNSNSKCSNEINSPHSWKRMCVCALFFVRTNARGIIRVSRSRAEHSRAKPWRQFRCWDWILNGKGKQQFVVARFFFSSCRFVVAVACLTGVQKTFCLQIIR